MLKNRNSILLGCLLAGAALAPLAAQANPIVSMELTGNIGTSLNQEYTAPYYAQIAPAGLTSASQFTAANSVTTAVYCDDLYDNVNAGDIWQATVTNMSELSSTSALTGLMFDTGNAAEQVKNYMAAAWLVEQIAGLNQSLPSGQLQAAQDSYALWYIFDPHALSGLSWSDSKAVLSDYYDALAAIANDTPSDFSNIDIYTPVDDKPGCADSQEYLAIVPRDAAPEPSTLSLAALGLAAVGFAARRRRRAPAAA